MTFFRAILISAFCALVSVPVFGAVDPREAVDWSKYPQVVHVQAFVSDELFYSCTGQYVAPNLILTAAHCILNDGGNLYGNINVVTYAGKKCAAQQAFWVGNYLTADNSYPYDFAVLQIEPECYSSINYKIEVSDIDKDIDVYNVGFGSLTILSDNEIKKLREKFTSLPVESRTNAGIVEQEFTSVLGRPIRDVFDNHKLKLDARCSGYRQQSDNVVYTDCYDWNGNSGSPIVQRGTNNLIGVMAGSNNNGFQHIGVDEKFVSGGASTVIFEKWLADIIKNFPPTQLENTVVDNTSQTGNGGNGTSTTKDEDVSAPVTLDNNASGENVGSVQIARMPGLNVADIIMNMNQSSGTPETEFRDLSAGYTVPDFSAFVEDVEETKTEKQQELNVFVNKKQTTDIEFVRGVLENVIEINRLSKLEEAYKKAKENEKSLKNRLVSGLSMAATGIGGMQLAQGLAEQSADAAAERDMQAYLATFQCTAGGKTYSGGTSGIELAGANQLTSLYQQYVDLAADLKERKAALGMKAGIESEVILDKANMGLYDDVGKGIENGTYASLYRASKGNEKDIKKFSEDKDTAQKRVKGGAIAAGAGAVGGGILGNVDFSSWGSGNASSAFSSLGSNLGSALGNSNILSAAAGALSGSGGASNLLGNAAGALSGSGGGIDSSTINSVLQAVGK